MASSPASSSEHVLSVADKLPFFSGIPAVEVTKGILHLYKLRCVPLSSLALGKILNVVFLIRGTASLEHRLESCGEVLCVLNISAHQHLSDMLEFLSPIL